MEPVNGGALDESRESTGPNTKGTAHGRQTQYHLQRSKQGNSECHQSTNIVHKQVWKISPYKIHSQVHIGKSTQVIDITDASKRETRTGSRLSPHFHLLGIWSDSHIPSWLEQTVTLPEALAQTLAGWHTCILRQEFPSF